MHSTRKIRTVFIQTVAVLLLACASWGQTSATRRDNAAPISPSSPADWLPVLLDKSAPQEARDAAARKLVATRQDAVRDELVKVLNDDRTGGDTAVCQALADLGWPDPAFVSPLEADLRDRSENPQVRTQFAVAEAAAALEQFDSTAQADEALKALRSVLDSTKATDTVRLPVIRAIGLFTQRTAAETLIDLLDKDSQDIVSAAGDALGDMTGLNNGHNVGEWQKWWNSAKNNLVNSLKDSRDKGYLQQRRRAMQNINAQDQNLRTTFNDTPPSDRPALILRCLWSSDAAIREFGAGKFGDAISTGSALSPQALQEVRDLLADPVADVRAAAAAALSGDSASMALLMDQLKRETDDGVRVALIKSLSQQPDATVVAYLLTLLKPTTSTPVQIEIAKDGISGAATLIQKNPDLRREVQNALQNAYKDKENALPNKRGLRAAIILAMGEMRDSAFKQTFLNAFKDEKDAEIQADAILGLGNLRDKAQASFISQILGNQPAVIRAAAATAMRDLYDPLYINLLANVTEQDPNDSVKQEAWDTLRAWLPLMAPPDLASLESDLNGDLDKQLIVQQTLVDKLGKATGNWSDLAIARDNLGTLLNQKHNPASAAEQFRLAFEAYRTNNGEIVVLDRLAHLTTQAFLDAGDWKGCTDFVSKVISDFSSQPEMGSIIRGVSGLLAQEESKLAGDNDPATLDLNAANELYDAIQSMPVKPTLLDDINTSHSNAALLAATTRKSSP